MPLNELAEDTLASVNLDQIRGRLTGVGSALLLALSIGCGGGTDGKPVAPPTTPASPVTPAPEPPAKPTGIHVSDRGQDFVEWTWDPVEGATGYEADVFLAGSALDERTSVHTEEPSYRWEGLAPSTSVRIFVRAVRQTAGGRAVSLWSDIGTGLTKEPITRLGTCSNERELALEWERGEFFLVSKWNPDRPFRVWVEEEEILEGGNELGRPDFLFEEVLEPLRDAAYRIEERLGYPIFDPFNLLSSQPSRTEPVIRVLRWTPVGLRDPPWDANCLPATHAPMSAIAGRAEMTYNDPYFFDPTITCSGFVQDRTDETIIHELGHLFGMKHFLRPGDTKVQQGGVYMSDPLTFHKEHDDSDYFLLQEDIDAIGCIFPHPDYPR